MLITKKSKFRKLLSLALSLTMVVSLTISASGSGVSDEFVTHDELACDHDHGDLSLASAGWFIPDYFAENGIDTTPTLSISNAKTAAQLSTMINTTYPAGSYYSTTGSA